MPEQSWLGELYREFRRPLFLVAWNVLRCTALAEDAVHSAFVRMAGLELPPRDPRLYVFRAVRNAALDTARRRGTRREQAIVVDIGFAETSPSWSGDETRCVLERALDDLDSASRETVELHLHSGLTFQEIAAIVDQPLPTVASRYRRALAKLRGLVEVCHE